MTYANRAFEWVPANLHPPVLGVLTLLSLAFFFIAIWPKVRVMWLAPPEDRFDNILKRLWNTLTIAFAQTRLFKDTGPGWMHALIFWGFLVLLVRASQFFVIGFFTDSNFQFPDPIYHFYDLFKDSFVFLVTLAATYGLYRRLVIMPARLSASFEGILILVLILIIMVTDILFEGAFAVLHSDNAYAPPLGLAAAQMVLRHFSAGTIAGVHSFAYWGHVSSILFFLCLLPRSKHFHIITSIPNVYFSNVNGKGNQLRRIDFEEEGREEFGVAHIEAFSWKKILDLHSCTECGRCDVFCPALKSGKPLSPKQLTVNLRDHLNRVTPQLLGSEKQAKPEPALLGGVILDETLWSCTTCGACEEECPIMIEYVNKVIDLRRGLVMTESRYPHELVNAFKSLETNANPWGFGRDSRSDWAKGLDIKLWDNEHPTEYLYFVGCNGAFDTRGRKIAVTVATLLKSAGVDFSILGNEEQCTGDPARRAGNEYLFDQLASGNATTFKEKGVRKVVTHCPHCFNSFKNEYPEFGVNLEVVHHSELLEHLLREGRLTSKVSTERNIVFHDSCYLGRHNKIYDAPRSVIAQSQTEVMSEAVNNRERGTCCGAGGARFLLEEKTGTRMNQNRVDELMQTQPDTIAVSCPFCVLMLEDGLKARKLDDKVKVMDIAELLQ